MRETAEDFEQLQALLVRSMARAGEHLRRTFEMPEHALSAAQLARYLAQPRAVALATVTARGEPPVAPVDSIFFRGRFHVPTVASAARATHVRRRPSVSLTHFVLDDVAIIAHGQATVVAAGHPDFAVLDEIYRAAWWTELRRQGEGIYLRIEAAALYTWARNLGEYPA